MSYIYTLTVPLFERVCSTNNVRISVLFRVWVKKEEKISFFHITGNIYNPYMGNQLLHRLSSTEKISYIKKVHYIADLTTLKGYHWYHIKLVTKNEITACHIFAPDFSFFAETSLRQSNSLIKKNIGV
jgi:hypothetical protein